MFKLRVHTRYFKCIEKTKNEICDFYENKKREILELFDDLSVTVADDVNDFPIFTFSLNDFLLPDYWRILSVFVSEDETSEYYPYRVSCYNWIFEATNILGVGGFGCLSYHGFIESMYNQVIHKMEEGQTIEHPKMIFFMAFLFQFCQYKGHRLYTDTELRKKMKNTLDLFEYLNIEDEVFFDSFIATQIINVARANYIINKRKTYTKRLVKLFKVYSITNDEKLDVNEAYCHQKKVCPDCGEPQEQPHYVLIGNGNKRAICCNTDCRNYYSLVNAENRGYLNCFSPKETAIEDNYSLFSSDEPLLSVEIKVKRTQEEQQVKQIFDILYTENLNYGFYQTNNESFISIITRPLGIKTFWKLYEKVKSNNFGEDEIRIQKIFNYSSEIESKILELISQNILNISSSKTIILDFVEMKIRITSNEVEQIEKLSYIFKKTQENENGLCDVNIYEGRIGSEEHKNLLSVF